MNRSAPAWVLAILMAAGGSAPAADKSGVRPSVISLPSGPGSIEGLGESFEPQLNSGTSSHSIPLSTLPGRAGFAPELALTYSSGGASGIVGLGWSLSLPSIHRQTDKGMPLYVDGDNGIDDDGDGTVDEFDERDTIIYSSGEELVPLLDGTWRSENEQDFMRFERAGDTWTARRRDGVLLSFGGGPAARIAHPSLGGSYGWLLDRLEDTNGNVIRFVWSGGADGTQQSYLQAIQYNPDDASGMVINFTYAVRPDPIFDFRPGFALVTAKRLTRIEMREAANLVRAYRLAYIPTSSTQPLSLLASLTTEGRDGTSTLPPAEFTYTTFNAAASSLLPMPTAPLLSLGGDVDLLDLNGDALPDILDTGPTTHRYFLNRGPDAQGVVGWSSAIPMTASNTEKLSSPNVTLADIDGDAQSNLLRLDAGGIMQMWRLDTALTWQSAGFLVQAGFSLSDPDTRLVDIDNDKRIDVLQTGASLNTVWLSLPNGRYSSPIVTAAGSPALRLSSATTHLADMNGDRLQDLVRLDNLTAEYRPAMGGGRFGPLVTLTNPPSGVTDPSRLLPMDVNGDGLADVVWINGSSAVVRINLGIPDASAPAVGALAPPLVVAGPATTGSAQYRVADVNGNGSADILWNDASSFVFVDFQQGEQSYQLKTITNGIGKTTTIAYGTSTAERERDRLAGIPWARPTPSPIPLVKRIEVKDGREQVVYATAIDYHDGYFDGQEREFRGFARAERYDLGDDTQGAPTQVTAYEYHLGDTDEALKGKPFKVEVRDGNGGVFNRETETWTVSDLAPDLSATLPGDTRTVSFAYSATTRREVLERGLGTPVVLLWERAFDNFGNQVLNAEYGRVEDLDNSGTIGDSAQDRAAWDDERVTVSTWSAAFPSGRAAWILDHLIEQEIRDDQGTVYARERHYYDDETFAGANLGEISAGNRTLTRAWHDPADPAGYINAARTAFDEFGNPTDLYDPLWGSAPGHRREIVYDNTYRTFPIEERIHTGNPDAPDDVLVLSVEYDFGFGNVTTSTDFNGFATGYGYDAFGRLVAVIKPGDSPDFPTTEYSYILAHSLGGGALINWVETRQRETTGGGTLDSRSFFDGLGRKVMTRAEGEDLGQIVVSDTVQFNARQEAWKKYLPYFETGTLDFVEPSFATGHTRHDYDAVGREVRSTQPQGPDEPQPVFSRITYQPLKRIVEDEEQTRPGSPHAGAKMGYVFDGLLDKDGQGRLREVLESVKLTDDGHLGPLTTWTTRYRYDVLDNFLGYTDAQNNQKHLFYDGLKRQVFMNDPDRSWTWYAFDAAGNLVRTRDARGNEVAYRYDGVNRLLSEHYATPSENTGNALSYNQRWIAPGEPPARPADVAYHYDGIAGPIETGYDPEPRTTPAILVDAILDREPEQPGFDLTSDGLINALDVARSVELGTSRTGTGGPLIPFEVVTARNVRGTLAWVRDQSGEQHNSFDPRGRPEWVVKKIRTSAGVMASFKTQNAFDAMDRITRLIYPDNNSIDYTYNRRGLLESIPGIVPRADYNPAGQLARLDYQIGTETRTEFDHRLRPNRMHTLRLSDGVALQDLNYTYDAVSNITAITDGRTDAHLDQIGVELGINPTEARKFRETKALQYDDSNRLTRAENTALWGEIDYRYDRIGNMVHRSAVLAQPVPALNLGEIAHGGSALGAGNPAASARDGRVPGAPAGPHAATSAEPVPALASFDATGNVATFKGATFAWDHLQRLTARDSGTIQYTTKYDFNHLRRRETTPTGDVLFVDQATEVRGNQISRYVFGGNRRIGSVTSSGGMRLLLSDHLGSVVAVLDQSGLVVEARSFFPYGTPRLSASVTQAHEAYSFQDKERAADGLSDFGRRHLLADFPAFASVDPILVPLPQIDRTFDNNILLAPQQLNGYVQVNNSPLKFSDPDGREISIPWSVIAEVGAKRGAAAGGAALLDGPIPGPGDAVGIVILIGGIGEVGYKIYLANESKPDSTNDEKLDELIDSGKKESKSSTIKISRPGGEEARDREYGDLGLNDVEDKAEGIKVGETDSGRRVVSRPSTDDKRPTIEVQRPDGRPSVKIRYDNK
ncbi:MAG: SpvB/TcaC N-terminal domain-containing protein [Lysobacterales bacterium]